LALSSERECSKPIRGHVSYHRFTADVNIRSTGVAIAYGCCFYKIFLKLSMWKFIQGAKAPESGPEKKRKANNEYDRCFVLISE
jgi:hypothetical protein